MTSSELGPPSMAAEIKALLAEQMAAIDKVREFNYKIAEAVGDTSVDIVPELRHTAPAAPGANKGKRLQFDVSPAVDLRSTIGTAREPLLLPKRDKGMDCLSPTTEPGRMRRFNTLREGFAQTEETEQRVSQALNTYHFCDAVADDFADSGFWASLARDATFQGLTHFVIILNLLWMGFETDNNKATVLCKAPLLFVIVDNMFCVFFVFEISIRFLAYESKLRAYAQPAFLFDLLLAVEMVWETWIESLLYIWFHSGSAATNKLNSKQFSCLKVLRILRLFRIVRAARMKRLLDKMPQLIILIKGMVAAMKSVLAILFMLAIAIYAFAITFTQLFAKHNGLNGHFQSVPEAMQVLLTQVLCGVDGDFMLELLDAGLAYYVLFLVYVFIGSLTMMNMLIGVLCDVMNNVSQSEKSRLDKAALRNAAADMISFLDHGSPKKGQSVACLSRDEFDHLMEQPHIMTRLSDLGVDIAAFVNTTRVVMPEDGVLLLNEFFQLILQCRESKLATVKDVTDSRRVVSMELESLKGSLHDLHATVGVLEKARRHNNAH